MDEFAKRLKEDAAKIDAEVSAELQARIEASIHATDRKIIRPAVPARRASFWWASSLTGLAAAAIVFALLDRLDMNEAVDPKEAPVMATVPKYVRQLNSDFSLRVENAYFAEPLEDELQKLKADIEKARNNLRRELSSSL